jgi:hypothetical protein
MIEKVDTEMDGIGVRLLDDAYLAWFSAESECEAALQAWFDAGAGRATAYLSYSAALDREEAAARDLQRIWQVSAACREALVHGNESVC